MLRQHCLALFDEMKTQQDAESAERAEHAEKECLESPESPERLQISLAMPTLGSCHADARSFSTTISACAKGGDWKRSLQLFTQMQRWSIVPDRHCHTALLSSFQRGRAWRLGLEHILKPWHATFGSWNALNELDGIGYDTSLSLCEAGAWQEALVILGRMRKQNLEPSIAGLFSLVKTIQNASCQQDQQDTDATSPNYPNYGQFRALNPSFVWAKELNSAVEGIQTDVQSTLQGLHRNIYSKAIAVLRQIQDQQASGKRKSKATNSQIVHVVRALDLDHLENEGALGEELLEVFREVVVTPVTPVLKTLQTATSATSATSDQTMDILGEIHGLGVHFTHEARCCLANLAKRSALARWKHWKH